METLNNSVSRKLALGVLIRTDALALFALLPSGTIIRLVFYVNCSLRNSCLISPIAVSRLSILNAQRGCTSLLFCSILCRFRY